MPVSPAAGCKIYIGGTGVLASEEAFQLIGKVANMGEFGTSFDEILFSSLDDRNVLKFKGQRNDGSLSLQLGRDATEDGQADLVAAVETDFDYNFKIELNDAPDTTENTPTTFVFKAKVMSYTTQIGEANSIVGSTAGLGIQSGTIVEVPAA
jgi:hypothetical protein